MRTSSKPRSASQASRASKPTRSSKPTKTSKPSTVAAYIAGFPRPVQTVLRKVRGIIRAAVPGATEGISYGIPAFSLDGRRFIYFAGWKRHYSLYPVSARLAAAFRRELTPYELSHKGTVRFPLDEPVPETLIAAIAKFRATESG